MKTVQKAEAYTAYRVAVDGEMYTRYAPDNWTVIMGESDEPVYDCAELEAAFQAYMVRCGTPNPNYEG